MRIEPNSRLMSMPINSDNIFHFPNGIPAFEHVKEYIFIHRPDLSPFLFMHAIEPNDLSFVCIDPFIIHSGYKPQLSDSDTSFLHLQTPSDLLLLSIVTVAKDAKNTTANLQAPIAINIQACIGKQIICENQSYPIRHKIWDSIEKNLRTQDQEKSVVVC